MTADIAILARAKVNLGLKVLGPRHDGFHNVDTVLQAVELSDLVRIRVRSAGESRVTVWCNHQQVPAGSSNLAHQAAILFLSSVDAGVRVDVSISKVIPVGAGLGGGSADAAAVLFGLSLITDQDVPTTDLAAQLGSDVPFFLAGGSCRATGRGTRLEQLRPHARLAEMALLLVKPPFSVSAGDAYRSWIPGQSEMEIDPIVSLLARGDTKKLPQLLFNDLEPGVLRSHPSLGEIKEAMVREGLKPLMSGSGSTLFALLPDGRRVWDTALWIKRRFPSLTVLATRPALASPLEVIRQT